MLASIIMLPAMTGDLSPSMVELGQSGTPDLTVLAAMPAPAQPPIAEPGHVDIISPSIIALGEPAVANENVAAIAGKTKKCGTGHNADGDPGRRGRRCVLGADRRAGHDTAAGRRARAVVIGERGQARLRSPAPAQQAKTQYAKPQ